MNNERLYRMILGMGRTPISMAEDNCICPVKFSKMLRGAVEKEEFVVAIKPSTVFIQREE